MTKHAILRVLRAARLLRAMDAARLCVEILRTLARNRRFARESPQFLTPPRGLAFDALNHADWRLYREGGLAHARLFACLLREAFPGDGAIDVMEWGCGPGRIVRHMPALMGVKARSVTGCDSNARSVAWCRRSLPGIRFVDNGLHPPTPFGDGEFDAIYGFSVLTHLSAAVQVEWAGEFARLLRPGGVLVLTTHGEAYRHLLASPAERNRFAAGEVVAQANYPEGRKWFFAIHPEAFVRGRLLAGLEEVRRCPTVAADDVRQDVWIARKPGPGSRATEGA